MNIKNLAKLVEIKTKVSTTLPFILATLFTIYKYNKFNLINMILLFLSMFLIDLTTTALNNFIDFKKAKKRQGYGFEEHNALGAGAISESQAKLVIMTTLILAIIFGLTLFVRTNFIVLIIGIISFGVGILYSFGPLPISRTPFGEFFSGFFNGVVVVFLSVFIHLDTELLELKFFSKKFILNGNYEILLYIILLSIPCWMAISNIMLANNICDIEDDVINNRHTFPVIVGEKTALGLFVTHYAIAGLTILIMTIIGELPITAIVMIPIFYDVYLNAKKFIIKHEKKETFILSVKNHIMILVGLIFTVLTGIIFKL